MLRDDLAEIVDKTKIEGMLHILPDDKDMLTDRILVLMRKLVEQRKTGKCDTPLCQPELLVTHDMAIDAGDRELEGTVFSEATYERCGGCPSCIKDQIVDDLLSELEQEMLFQNSFCGETLKYKLSGCVYFFLSLY